MTGSALELVTAGVVVNRLGRTRDAATGHEQLVASYGDLVVGPIHLWAAIAEASAQSCPCTPSASALAPRSRAEFTALLAQVDLLPKDA